MEIITPYTGEDVFKFVHPKTVLSDEVSQLVYHPAAAGRPVGVVHVIPSVDTRRNPTRAPVAGISSDPNKIK
jgi:hypothetical protein